MSRSGNKGSRHKHIWTPTYHIQVNERGGGLVTRYKCARCGESRFFPITGTAEQRIRREIQSELQAMFCPKPKTDRRSGQLNQKKSMTPPSISERGDPEKCMHKAKALVATFQKFTVPEQIAFTARLFLNHDEALAKARSEGNEALENEVRELRQWKCRCCSTYQEHDNKLKSEATEVERERCARVAEQFDDYSERQDIPQSSLTKLNIATAIRRGGS